MPDRPGEITAVESKGNAETALAPGRHFSMRDYMQGIGLELRPDGDVTFTATGLVTPFVWTISETVPDPEDFVLARSGTTLEDVYRAAEWEGMRPELPAPLTRDGGPVAPLPRADLAAMPANRPVSMRKDGYAPSRRQRRAAETARRRKDKAGGRLH